MKLDVNMKPICGIKINKQQIFNNITMKIRTLKKILKRANTTKVITLKDGNTLTKGICFMLNYAPKFEKPKYDKFGVTIKDKITNISTKSFPYNKVVKVE